MSSRERRAASARKYNLRSKYGITPEHFDAMLARQGGGCAICGAALATRAGQRLHVDHDHETDEVRGLLCTHCNVGLGQFRDDPTRLRRAIGYLTQPLVAMDDLLEVWGSPAA